MNRTLRGSLMLFTTAFIWGSAFVAQKAGMDYIGPFTYNGLRCLIGALVLVPVFLLLNRLQKRKAGGDPPDSDDEVKNGRKTLLIGGLACGAAYTLQIIGQKDVEPSVASLILSLESVFAVITGIIVLHEQVLPREVLGCVIMFAAILIAQLPEKKTAA